MRQSLIPGLKAGFLSASHHGPRGQLFPQPRVKAAKGDERLLDEVTGSTFRIVVSANADAATVVQVVSECERLRHLPIELVLIGSEPLAQDAPLYAYFDVSGVLVNWLRQHDCSVVIARPDHYVYGACQKPGEASALIQELVAALSLASLQDRKDSVAST